MSTITPDINTTSCHRPDNSRWLMMLHRYGGTANLLSWGYLLVVCVIYMLYCAHTPYILDDPLFLSRFKNYNNGSYSLPDLSGYFEWLFHKWKYASCGRLADAIFPFTAALMPKWLFSIFTAFFLGAIFVYVTKIATMMRESICSQDVSIPLTRVLAISLIVIFALYIDTFSVCAYSLNYIWSGAIILVFLYYFLFPLAQFSKAQIILLCLLSFIARWMHEGMSLVTTVLIVIAWIIKPKNFGKLQVAMFVCFCLGFLIVLLAPGMWCRASTTVKDLFSFNIKTIVIAWGFQGIYIIILLWRSFKNELPKKFLKKYYIHITIAVCCIVNLLMLLKLGVVPRMVFLNNLLATVGILSLLPMCSICMKRILWTVSILSVVISISLMIFAYRIELQYEKENNEIIAQLGRNSHDTVFYDIRTPQTKFERFIRVFYLLPQWKHFTCVSIPFYYCEGSDRDHTLNIIPTSLKDAEIREDMFKDGAAVCHNNIIVSCDAPEEVLVKVDIEGKGTKNIYCTTYTFITSDGKQYKYARFEDYEYLRGCKVLNAARIN